MRRRRREWWTSEAAHFAELKGDIARGGEALLRIFLHAVMDDVIESGRNS